MPLEFPDQTIPESQKGKEWVKKHLEYAQHVYDNSVERRKKILSLYDEYNGYVNPNKVKYLTEPYGKKSSQKFISYRITFPKMQLIKGEWLKRPLNTTVLSVNSEAKSKKLKGVYEKLGMAEAPEVIDKLRNEVGVDVFNGAQVLDKNAKDFHEKLNPKTLNEKYMQIILNHQKRNLDLKTKLSNNFFHVALGSECFGKVDILENNKVEYREIPPENAIYEEVEGDIFLEKTPIIGERRIMTPNDILIQFGHKIKNEDDKKKLKEMIRTSNKFLSSEMNSKRNFYEIYQDGVGVEVMSIEWMGLEPVYYKVSPNKKDPSSPYRKELSVEFYEANEKKIKRDVKKGLYEIEKSWTTVVWHATQIGHDIIVDGVPKPYRIFRSDDPSTTWYNYVGMIYNSVNGTRVSLQELMSELSFLYDTVMYQINRELAKNKGNVFVYDRAALPRGKSMSDVLYEVLEDQVLIVDSTAEGNFSGRNIDIKGISKVDLSATQSMAQLIGLRIDIQQTIDKISGINENREGQVSASSTATGIQQAATASRTITEPMFYFMEKYAERVFFRVIEKTKIAWVMLDSGEGDNIIGDEGKNLFELTEDLAYDDYAAYITDGTKEIEIRRTFETAAQAAINARELRIQDFYKLQLAETLADAKMVLDKGFEEVENIRQRDLQAQRESEQLSVQTQIEGQRAMIEDSQQHDKEMAIIEAAVKSELQKQKAKDTNLLNQGNALIEQTKQNQQRSNNQLPGEPGQIQ